MHYATHAVDLSWTLKADYKYIFNILQGKVPVVKLQ